MEYGFHYSRYADDMSFSFQRKKEGQEIKKLIFAIQCIVSDEGFRIKKEKTRYLKKNNRQCITGIVINNSEISVPKVWIKRMRAAIHNAEKLKKNGEITHQIRNEISGMRSWLISVNRQRYSKIIEDADNLLNS